MAYYNRKLKISDNAFSVINSGQSFKIMHSVANIKRIGYVTNSNIS